jgi:hypothetical protein
MKEPLRRFPLFGDPLAQVSRTVSESDPVQFAISKERHRLTIHERDLGKIDRDWSLLLSYRFSERVKVLSVNPAAQAQYHKLLDMPFDLAAHRVPVLRGNRESFRSEDKHTASHLELIEDKRGM